MSRGGLSLAEVVVALAIASLVALAAHATVGTITDLGGRSRDYLEETLRAVAVRREITHWLRGAYLYQVPEAPFFEGFDEGELGGGSPASMAFPSVSPDPFAMHRSVVTIGIARGAEVPRGVAAAVVRYPDRAQYSGFSSPSVEPGPPFGAWMLLVPGAESLEVRYLPPRGQGTEWLRGWISGVELPAAVELRILGDSVPDLLRVPIVLAWPRRGG